jgi:AcrR family transcriptional regulator
VYDSALRREKTRHLRAAILEACRVELERDGYGGLTVRAVAARAGASQETIYKTFGGKHGLVKALYDVTLAGDDEPVPMADRPELAAIAAEPDPRTKILGYARLARQVSERLGTITAILGAGGADAAGIVAQTERERLVGMTAFVAHLAAGGHLPPGADRTRLADACWVLTSPQLYRLCTAGRGWTPDVYEEWLAGMLSATLLGTARA